MITNPIYISKVIRWLMKLQVCGDSARAGRSHNLRWGTEVLGNIYGARLHLYKMKISPVAARPINTKRPTLMKASFQRADLFVFTDSVGGLISSLCGSISRCSVNEVLIINELQGLGRNMVDNCAILLQ